jgi:predicted transcriptional regulator
MSDRVDELTPDPGIFLTQGGQVSIPSFSITIDENGSISSDPVTLHLGLDVCPVWMEIAFDHLILTHQAAKRLELARVERNDESIASALEAEYKSGMQAIVCSGIAMDAYYATVKKHANIPQTTLEAWKKNRTARYKQVAETLKIAFSLSTKFATSLRSVLEQNFRFRDMGVHPKQGTYPPALHPELNKIVDWRYVTFRHYNAKGIVGLTLKVIYQTASTLSANVDINLRNHCTGLIQKLKPILGQWGREYGQSFEQMP